MDELLHKVSTDRILRAGLEVHRALGPGLLESTYELCLFDELARSGLQVARQVELAVVYKDRRLDCGYRIDLLVDDSIIIEVKSVDAIAPIHKAQLITYLKLAGLQVGLLLNFNVKLFKDGIVRRVLSDAVSSSALSASSAVHSPGES